jgi:hypothetical protein
MIRQVIWEAAIPDNSIERKDFHSRCEFMGVPNDNRR